MKTFFQIILAIPALLWALPQIMREDEQNETEQKYEEEIR